MKYAFFSDLHFGSPSLGEDRLALFLAHLDQVRREGCQVVFLGDMYELDGNPDALQSSPKFLQEHDYWIPGNHDPYPVHGTRYRDYFYHSEGKIFAIHGDEFDFQYMATLWEHRPPFYLKWLGLRREHAVALHRAIVESGASSRKLVFDRKTPWTTWVKLFFHSLSALRRVPPRTFPPLQDFTPVPGPLIRPSASVRLGRIHQLWPPSREAKIVVHGHTHYPSIHLVDEVLLIDLGAWVGSTPLVLIYDLDRGSLIFRSSNWGALEIGPGVSEILEAIPEGFQIRISSLY